MEIRDTLHGSIAVSSSELPVIDSRYFQRLRQIKQLGFAEYSFPSATHNRYVHSLGAMETATRAFDTIFDPASPIAPRLSDAATRRWRAAVRLAALLHDVGHGPLSHTTEFAMPEVRHLRLPPSVPGASGSGSSRRATHEDYTLKILLDSSLTPLVERAAAGLGFSPLHVAALIDPGIAIADDFFTERVEGPAVDFRPLLQQLISSELDADRMDYLRRDSLNAGVSYGQFDFAWLIGNLTCHLTGGRGYLALQHRALYSFEDFLISRFHMFLMVYFHYKSVVFDSMLARYFASPDLDYALPADIERYADCDDAHLYAHLARSRDPWAARITAKRPYRMLVELHSGIPATRTAAAEQERLLGRVQADLDEQGVDYLTATSTSQFSKYFRTVREGGAEHAPIFVRYDNHYSAPGYIPVEQCTDLFERYREKRSITRLYVSPEDYVRCRHQGRGSPLPYEDDLAPGAAPFVG
jgi:uncharacterized protein